MLSILLRIVIIAAGAYVCFGVLIWLTQARLVYYPTSVIEADPGEVNLQYEDVALNTADGVRITGWFVPAGSQADVVLLFHGNGGNISHRLDTLYLLNSIGLSTLIIDYRGYGRSAGEPNEAGTYLDAECAWDYLTEVRRISPDRIILYGRSLGGAIASHLATRRSPKALVIQSCFTSARDLGAEMYPLLPVRWLCRFNYDTRAMVADVKCPVFVIHSRADSMIPFQHGRRIFQAAREPKEFIEVEGDHNDSVLDRPEAIKRVFGKVMAM